MYVVKCNDCSESLSENEIYGDDDAPIDHEGDYCKECWEHNHKDQYDASL